MSSGWVARRRFRGDGERDSSFSSFTKELDDDNHDDDGRVSSASGVVLRRRNKVSREDTADSAFLLRWSWRRDRRPVSFHDDDDEQVVMRLTKNAVVRSIREIIMLLVLLLLAWRMVGLID